jgi:hypothetical protein
MYDTSPLLRIDKRLNELEPVLKVYFPGICKANTMNSRLAYSHLDIAGRYTGPDTFEFVKNGGDVIPGRLTQAIHRIGGNIYLHCPKLSKEVYKLSRNKVLIVDADPLVYILNAKMLLKVINNINKIESKITINGEDLHVDILNKYNSIDINKLIDLVPDLCIDGIRIYDEYFETKIKKTQVGGHYFPKAKDNLIWSKFKIFISKCPSPVITVNVKNKTVERY